MPIVDAEPFAGAMGGFETTIDLTEIASLLNQVEEQTGVSSGSVEIVVVPNVAVKGISNGLTIEDTFTSPLSFTYGRDLITPGETLAFSESGVETSPPVERPNEVTLLGISARVSTLRTVATPVAIFGLALAGLVASSYFLGVGRPEAAKAQVRYRSLLVPVDQVKSDATHRITVGSLSDLADMAKREGRSLFVRDFDGDAHAYLVHDGMVIYQYLVGNVPEDWIEWPDFVGPASLTPPKLGTSEYHWLEEGQFQETDAGSRPANPTFVEPVPDWLRASTEENPAGPRTNSSEPATNGAQGPDVRTEKASPAGSPSSIGLAPQGEQSEQSSLSGGNSSDTADHPARSPTRSQEAVTSATPPSHPVPVEPSYGEHIKALGKRLNDDARRFLRNFLD